MKEGKTGQTRAADCGAGIGRVSIEVISKYFKSIDLIDPILSFLEVGQKKLEENGIAARSIPLGLQEWTPDCNYDIIWCQWSIMYLTDTDAIKFLNRCKEHLNPGGYIFVKDNIQSLKAKTNVKFPEDNGVARTVIHYRDIFKRSGLTFVEAIRQPEWDPNLLQLYTFVLKS